MSSRFTSLIDELVRANAGAPQHPALAAYVAKVRLHAYRVTDEDVAALKAAGIAEDDIFHATTAAALDAGLERWRSGLASLED